MSTKTPKDAIAEAPFTTTPETLIDAASKVQLESLTDRDALMIKLCVKQEENKCYQQIMPLKSRVTELNEKYKSLLRELRDTLRNIKFDDFLKVLTGASGGIVVRAVTQQELNTLLKDNWVLTAGLFFIVGFIFLIFRYFGPSIRKKEIVQELKRINENHE